MTAPEAGPLSDDATEADVLDQRAAAVPVAYVEHDDSPGVAPLVTPRYDFAPLEADPVDVAEQHQDVPLDFDDRGDPL